MGLLMVIFVPSFCKVVSADSHLPTPGRGLKERVIKEAPGSVACWLIFMFDKAMIAMNSGSSKQENSLRAWAGSNSGASVHLSSSMGSLNRPLGYAKTDTGPSFSSTSCMRSKPTLGSCEQDVFGLSRQVCRNTTN